MKRFTALCGSWKGLGVDSDNLRGKTGEVRAKEIAEAALSLACGAGAETVVVMVGLPDGERSAYYVSYKGRGLPLRGLVEIGAETVRAAVKVVGDVGN